MALAFSYLRMSRPEQIKGDSLRRQLDVSMEYAIEHGLTLNETMQDIGVSAFRGKNRIEATLAAFLDLIRDEEIPSGSVCWWRPWAAWRVVTRWWGASFILLPTHPAT